MSKKALNDLIKKIEAMSIEEFNEFMVNFIDRAHRMAHIGKVYKSIQDKFKKMKPDEVEETLNYIRQHHINFKPDENYYFDDLFSNQKINWNKNSNFHWNLPNKDNERYDDDYNS